MNRLLILFIALFFFAGCSCSVENGAFVGDWYVVGLEEGYEHWSIQKNNEVTIRNKFGEVVNNYILKDRFIDRVFGEPPYYYLVSADKKDTIGTTWVEAYPDEYTIPDDTIRFYHYFVMVRNKELPKTNLSKKEIVELLENSFWEYKRDSTKVELFLTDSLLENQKKRAYINISGCLDYSSRNEEWYVDTLTNNIVLTHTMHYSEDLLLVKEISNDKMKVDRDDVYWFNKNLVIKKTEPWDLNKFTPSGDFVRSRSTPACR
ncbi:MAG: hypothetical protein ROO71_03995 [Balneola sp.]